MSAVLLAVFTDYAAAEHVRIELVRDGFPTDRIELTATSEPGRAASEPGPSAHDRYLNYFGTLFHRPQERAYPAQLAEEVERGAATITVLPRGPVETARARAMLGHGAPRELVQHDLDRQGWEHAAARHEHSWASFFWPEPHSHTQCLYCRMFEDDALERTGEETAAKGPAGASR